MFLFIERHFIREDEYISFTKEMNRGDVKDYIVQCVMNDEYSDTLVNDDVSRIEDGDIFSHSYKKIFVTIEYMEVQ